MPSADDQNPFESPRDFKTPEAKGVWAKLSSPESVLRWARLGWKVPTVGAVFCLATVSLSAYASSAPFITLAMSLCALAVVLCLIAGIGFSLFGSLWYSEVPKAMPHAFAGIAANLLLAFFVLIAIMMAAILSNS